MHKFPDKTLHSQHWTFHKKNHKSPFQLILLFLIATYSINKVSKHVFFSPGALLTVVPVYGYYV